MKIKRLVLAVVLFGCSVLTLTAAEAETEAAGSTGVFSAEYFKMWAGIIGGIGLAWLKAYGQMNPTVGPVGGRVSSAVLKKGFVEVIEGGEWFKKYLKESKVAEDVKEEVLDMFSRAHGEAQSRDIKSLVSRITV